MARFRFRLQPVLEQREMIEREKQRAVGQLERERLLLEEAIRSTHAAIEREQGELRLTLGPSRSLDAQAVRMHFAAAGHLHSVARQYVLKLAGVTRRLEGARAELLLAARRRKAVELLRTRRLEQWKLEQSRRETAETDELAVMRAGRAPASLILEPVTGGEP